ncbi:hypothetical protein [Desulfobotulus mexicanus]|uniref:hypothetical protein n=1 Tax=Desulfobotulus mexicanus TaxID=2586642 RepID=UPI0015D190DE|nr:hypothetical protein [Desulfobotulus mexicanus]
MGQKAGYLLWNRKKRVVVPEVADMPKIMRSIIFERRVNFENKESIIIVPYKIIFGEYALNILIS